MRLLFIINTPSQAHTWHHIINSMVGKGHEVKILARDYGPTIELLKLFGFRCETFRPWGVRAWRLMGAVGHFQNCYRLVDGFSPSIFVGFGLDAAVTAMRLKKPCVVFIDDEHTYVQNRLTCLLASATITPDTFEKTLGRSHIRINSYKELAYLHPDLFKPDIGIFDQLKIGKREKYVVLRFNLFDAIHDIGIRGFSVSDQLRLVEELGKHVRVFIVPEGVLPKELDRYRLSVPVDRIHHVLNYAQLIVGDSGTMTTEAAVLGTPAVRFRPAARESTISRSFGELERRYGLIYTFQTVDEAARKAVELAVMPGLREEWAKKRQILLEDKVNLSTYMVNFLEGCSGVTRKAVGMSPCPKAAAGQ